MSTFVFDPNDIQGFVDRWMAEVGNIYRGQKYNGWALFNEQRELLDVYITDVDGNWVDFTDNPKNHENGAWDILIARARAVGATSIINVHTHAAGEPSGPCDGYVDRFFTSGVIGINEVTNGEITLRAGIVLLDDELDGMLWASEAQSPANMFPPEMRQAMLDEVRRQAARGNPTYQRILPLMERIVAGDPIDPDELIDGIRTLEAALNGIELPPQPQIIDPLGLPIMRFDDRGLLN